LILRIQGLLRRNAAATDDGKQAGPFQIDRASLKITVNGQRLDLTATEFKMLSYLISKEGSIQSREDLLREIWGYRSTVDTRTVDTHMRRLREKLGPHSHCLETVRGEGYRFDLPPA
jgi:two-component system phosphate regulon response regulator PhoB